MQNQNYRVCGVMIDGKNCDMTFHRYLDTAQKQAAKLIKAYDKRSLQIRVEIRFLNQNNKYQLIEG